MKLVDEFYDFIKENDLNEEDFEKQEVDNFTIVSFAEEGEPGIAYNVAVVFYNEGDIEVYARKLLKKPDETKLLKKLNDLNMEYRAVTFVYDDGMAMVKSSFSDIDNVDGVLAGVVKVMDVAKEVFPPIK